MRPTGRRCSIGKADSRPDYAKIAETSIKPTTDSKPYMHPPLATQPRTRPSLGFRLKQLALPIAVAAVTAAAPSAPASNLQLIPLLPDGLPYSEYTSEGRCITPDGGFVGGANYTSAVSDGWGFLYDVTNNNIMLPNGGGAEPMVVTGIGYRTDPVGLLKEIIMDGADTSGSYQADWMTYASSPGTTWGAKRRNTALIVDPAVGGTLAVVPDSSVGAFFAVASQYSSAGANNERNLYTCLGSNTWNGATACAFRNIVQNVGNPDAGHYNGVAYTGRAVGWYRTNYDWPALDFYKYQLRRRIPSR